MSFPLLKLRFPRCLCFSVLLLALLLASSFVGAPLHAAEADAKLPLPRFVSLRSDRINMRIGPGERYPVEWVYRRPDLPVEIIAEFENWRKIRDHDGAEGWVHQSMVSGRRTMIVIGGSRYLHRDASHQSAVVAVVEAGVLGRLLQCPPDKDACKVDILIPNDEPESRARRKSIQGWLARNDFWGVYPSEYIE